MLLVPRGSAKCAGLVAMKKRGEAFNTSSGFGWLPEEAALSQFLQLKAELTIPLSLISQLLRSIKNYTAAEVSSIEVASESSESLQQEILCLKK